MDDKVKNEDGAVKDTAVPGEGYNNESGYETETQQGDSQAPGRGPAGRTSGQQNENSREADREGE
ncbi:MAG TPA: hypothetical protein VNT60_07470 [Deinococcales bacterium]|nr:hypothetical protein [Deinococcales bacterium]